MADLTNKQKKEWAGMLYLKENLTQQEIAEKVGVSRITVNTSVRLRKAPFIILFSISGNKLTFVNRFPSIIKRSGPLPERISVFS